MPVVPAPAHPIEAQPVTDDGTFEGLGLSPDLIESLAAEGFERPTPFQSAAIPVLGRGNHVVGSAGAGAGVMLAYACPLIDRIASGVSQGALVLHASAASAVDTARSLAPVASGLGVSVAALRSLWVSPGAAQILFGTPAHVLAAVQSGEVKLEGFDSVVVINSGEIESDGQGRALNTLLEQIEGEGLRAVIDLPVGETPESFAEQFCDRPVHIPPRSATGKAAEAAPPTGTTVLYQIVESNRSAALLQRLSELSGHGRRIATLFRTDDQVADVGDLMSMYGYDVGEVGDLEATVWISNDSPESVAALQACGEPLTVVSYETPSGQPALERAANDSHEWLIFARTGEMAHLRVAATAAGIRLRAAAPLASLSLDAERDALAGRLKNRLTQGGLAPYAGMAASVLDGHDPIEVAAAALALLAERPAPEDETQPAASGPRAGDKAAIQAWSKLFVSIGERDGVRIGDLLGAVTNEANVKGLQVGRIDVQESHSLIEVDGTVADRVIKALNGTSIRGRSLRVDYDRSHRPQDARAPKR